MLKRQRPATPPPFSLDSMTSFLPDGPIRPLQSLAHAADPSQPRSKRRRIRLDGTTRGWLQAESAGPHWESDGEEDWIEDTHDVSSSLLPPSATADQYKGTNSLLHELHVLNQHRLLFAAHPSLPRDRHSSPHSKILPPIAQIHDPQVEQRPTTWVDRPYHPALPSLIRDEAEHQSSLESAEEKELVEEVRCVRQHYEDTNRLLGSLFLSRRREVETTYC